jgi:hypothetical protein
MAVNLYVFPTQGAWIGCQLWFASPIRKRQAPQAAGIEPIVLQANFGCGFLHPHLRGTTVHDWPLNVFSEEDAAAQLSVLRAIASSDLHNLVYRSDYRVVPVVMAKTSG